MLYNTVLLPRGWFRNGFQALAVATLMAALVLFAGPADPARAATLVVDPATEVDPTCPSLGPFKTIQRAIDCATAGDVIQVAAGTYNEDITISKPLHIQGAGIDQSIIVGQKESGGSSSTVSFAANNIILEGFNITRDGNNLADWTSSTLNVNGVTFNQGRTGNTLQNCKVTGNRNGVYLNNTQGHTVKNNLVVFNRTGFQFVNNASNNVIQENEITGNWTMGVLFNTDNEAVTTNISINNNHISGNWYGDVQCRWTNSTALLDLSGNWFGGTTITKSNVNSSEPVYADLIPEEYGGTATNPGGAVMIGGTCSHLVDYTPWLNSGADTGPGIGFQGDFSALNVDDDSPQSGAAGRVQEGIDRVTPGGSVSLRNGLYLESNIAVNKAATIAGESQANVILAPAGEDDNDANSSFGGTVQNGFLIQEDGVTIRDLTIDGQGNAALTAGKNNFRAGIITDFRIAADITFSNLTFRDLVVKNIFRRGIQLSTGGSSNLIAGNTVSNVSGAAGSYAIASFAGDGVISGNTVSDSTAGIAANGLYDPIDDYPLLTIQGNTLTNNPIGMNLAALEDGSIIGGPGAGQGNSISTTGGDNNIGLLVTFAHGTVTVQQNTIQGSASDAGLWLFRNEDAPVQILGNTFSATASSSTNPGQGTAIFMTDDHTLLGETNTGAGLAVIAGNTISGFYRGIDLFRDGTLNEGPKPLEATIGGLAAGDSNTLTGPATAGSTGIRVFDEDGPDATANATASIINNNASITHFETGIRVDGGLATIQKNAILTNSTAVLVEYGGVATVTLNSIAGNTAFGVNNTTGTKIDTSCNWWGSPTGPTHAGNPGATGDKASDDTAYSPWAGSNSYDCAVKYAIPTRLVFSTQPGDGVINSPFSPQPVVRAEDDAGNLGYNFSGPVSLALSPAGAALQGTNPLNAANGVVTFNGLSIDATGTYTLTATATGLAGATSSSFVIGQHPPVYLPLVTKP